MAAKTPLDILREMRALLAAPERWTQGWFAHDSAGITCGSLSHGAAAWCLVGAMVKVTGANSDAENRVEALLRPHINNLPLDLWNDYSGRTHADVLNLLDECIREQEQAA